MSKVKIIRGAFSKDDYKQITSSTNLVILINNDNSGTLLSDILLSNELELLKAYKVKYILINCRFILEGESKTPGSVSDLIYELQNEYTENELNEFFDNYDLVLFTIYDVDYGNRNYISYYPEFTKLMHHHILIPYVDNPESLSRLHSNTGILIFTLLYENNSWKIASTSYSSTPINYLSRFQLDLIKLITLSGDCIDSNEDLITDCSKIKLGGDEGIVITTKTIDDNYTLPITWNGNIIATLDYVLENNKIPIINHGTNDTTFTLTPNVYHIWGEVSSLTLTLGTGTNGYLSKYTFEFISGYTATTLSLPNTIKWKNDPDIKANKYYQISIINNIASIIEILITHNVTFNFTNLTTTAPNKANQGESYNVLFTPDTGKQLVPSTVVVTMGGVDVTEYVYNFETNQIVIPSVTNDVTIKAEAASISSDYVPVMWIEGTRYSGGKGTFKTPYYPKNTTKVEIECAPQQYRNYAAVFGTAAMSTDPRYQFQAKYAANDGTSFSFGNSAAARYDNDRIAIGSTKQTIVANGNSVTYTNRSGNRVTMTVNSSLATWTSTRVFQILGTVENIATSYWSKTRMWRCKISEGNTLLYDYVPVKKNSDGSIGIYDVVSGVFIAGDVTMEITYIERGGTISNCTATLLSGATTGTTNLLRLGETWSCKYTPSSEYTFNSDEATFQVIINNEDVTSEVATYDSTTDSWTVTLVAHWGDTISVTASPAEIVEVEYILSTGASNIITNYVPTGTDIRILSKFNVVEYTDNTSYVGILACINIGDSYNQYRIIRNNTTNNAWLCNCGSKSAGAGTTVGFTLNTIQEVDMSHTRIIRNGNTVNMKTTQGSPNTSRFYVGGNKLTVKYWYVQIYDGETLVLDLVPTRIGTRACFKDNVSGEFLFPTGTAWTYQDKVALNMSNPNTINNTNPDNEEEEEI